MPFALTANVLWALASGVGLAALGGALLWLRPRRPDTLVFAAFTLAWAGQILSGNLARATDAAALYRLSLAFALPTAVFLVHFAARQAALPERAGLVAVAGFGGAAAAAAVAFLVAPESIIEGLRASPSSGLEVDYGPASMLLVFPALFLAFDAGAWWTLRRYERARGPTRRQARLVLAALLVSVSYTSVRNLAQLTLFPSAGAGLEGSVFVATHLVGLLVTGAIGLRIARGARLEGLDPLLLGAALVPALVAGAEWGLLLAGFPRVETLGLWRLATVALIAYAIAKFQLFDLDVRLRGASARVLPLAAAALAGATAWTVVASPPMAPLLAVAVAAPAGLAAWRFREAAARALFPAEPSDPDYVRARKLEVYSAGLERALADEVLDPVEERLLRSLRRSLDISEEEHARLEVQLRRAVPDDGPTSPGGVLASRYRIDRLLGEGGHGRAYLAYDERDDRQVVVKVVGTASLGGRGASLLLREARLLRTIRSPHVLQVFDVLERPGEAVLVVEYADGGSLEALLQRQGSLGLRESIAVLDQVLAALAAAHAKGIVHRDVKPANILLTSQGEVKLGDFGVAREEGLAAVGATLAGWGTLPYMAPEQVRGRPADARCDLYAAAAVFHACLTGRHYLPIAGKDDFQLRRAILHDPPKLALRGQPPWVGEFLRRALAKDPAKRFADAEAMKAALRAEPQAAR